MQLSHFIIFSIKNEMKYSWNQNSILAVLDLIQSNAIYNATYREVIEESAMVPILICALLNTFSIESQLHLLHIHISHSNTKLTTFFRSQEIFC